MMLQLDHLSKQYNARKWGLKDFSMTLRPGILGLLGPNGAGKSTLMRIIATITKPSSGQALFDGTDILHQPNALRRVLGYLPQDFGVYPNLTAVEFLEYIGAVKGLSGPQLRPRIEALLADLNLGYAAHKRIGTYSGGMKQRIGIAQALLNDPQVLIFDEPTVGLDPEERVRFRNLLADLAGERIVILSSHIVSDIETVATDIAIMAHGQLLAFDAPSRIVELVRNRVFEVAVPAEQLNAFKQRYLISHAVRRDQGWQVRFISDQPPVGARPCEPGVEEAYLWTIAQAKTA